MLIMIKNNKISNTKNSLKTKSLSRKISNLIINKNKRLDKFKTKTLKNDIKITNKYFKKYIMTKKRLKEIKNWKEKEMFYSHKLGKGYTYGNGNSIQEEISLCVQMMIKTPRIFIDVGAHKGEYTKEVLIRYPDIDIYMFEPSKAHTEVYKNSFKKMKNITIEHLGLSNKSGKKILYSDNYGSQLGSFFKRRLDHFKIYFNKKELINTIRFDEYWKSTDVYKNNPNTIIDYVKLDIEGFEIWALEGFGKIINNVGIIQFEFGGSNIDSRTYFQDFWYFFKDKDFSIYRIAPNGLIQITHYSEIDEFFQIINYIAVNNKINKINYFKNIKS
jgi:FkbM family methyltransferase